jgi:nucleotidyltransferase substrate binding protein (TIGR01987 family)
MKDFFASKGTKDVFGSKDAIRLAFKNELISYGEIWMNMVEDRYNTVHVYDEKEIKKITDNIRKKYFSAFKEFYTKMNVIKEKELLEKELQAE